MSASIAYVFKAKQVEIFLPPKVSEKTINEWKSSMLSMLNDHSLASSQLIERLLREEVSESAVRYQVVVATACQQRQQHTE